MKYRLKAKVSSRRWKLGVVVYSTLEEAQKRAREMTSLGVKVIIVDEFGGKLK